MEAQEPIKSFLYDVLLPKMEWLLWFVTFWGFVASWYQLAGWATLLIVAFYNLAVVSFLSAFSPYNSIDRYEPYFEPITMQEEREKESSFFLNILSPKIIGIAGAVVLFGTLCKLMFWTGYSTMLLAGTGWLLIIVVVMAFSQRMNMRAFTLAILGSSMLCVSSETLMRQLHRDDPKLVTLMVYQIQHPHDRAAAEAVRSHVNQKRIQR
ncbi:GldL-related protein [Hymenobacter negativus]|uniref:Gliding motility protein GldL-like N-terminal domain-containing protein n=1 Tax=Hymenobacter negativus TaxID=2795026 RepID=A0ABS3QMZ2_9BACT|nr:hypothetical protein [Hymenobacter negativus]MBO2012649.1 hypothetical protein [Hymenobacter negativus]